jgi:surfeit locus 1 family protein
VTAAPWRSPRFWLVTVAAVAAMAATSSLGLWQLSRASQKEALQAATDEKKALSPLGNADVAVMANADPQLHRPVQLQGRWLAQHSVYLDNRQMNGKPGFYVLTPLALDGGNAVVVVQRGWVQRNFLDRERLPPVETPAGVVQIQGRIAAAPPRLYEFTGAQQAPGSSAIRQNLDLAAYGDETRLALQPFTVVQTGEASQGLLREWPEAAAGTGKHYGYAFQWFGLNGLLAILYVWFQFIAPRRKARSS